MELAKESYERAGLQGVPVSSGGRKHVKARYRESIACPSYAQGSWGDSDLLIVVEVNLRLSSALHGKKGFDRLVWAAKNVLHQSLNWLFLNLNAGIATTQNVSSWYILTCSADLEAQTEGPLGAHHPTVQTLACSKQQLAESLTPAALTTCLVHSAAPSSEETEESVYDILEYLDMAALDSPRVQASDHIDSFLSRYTVPDPSKSLCSLQRITWNGLTSSQWVLELMCSIV